MVHIVLCCCKLNYTRDCDEHLFEQVKTCTGYYQLPIFCSTNVHPWRSPIIKARRLLMISWDTIRSQQYVYSFQRVWFSSSGGGLVVERWSDNILHSATVGSNLHQVWCITGSVEETLCHNSITPRVVSNTQKMIIRTVNCWFK